MLKSREEVYRSLRVLDAFFFNGGHRGVNGKDEIVDKTEAAGHVEALMETFRPDNDRVRLEVLG